MNIFERILGIFLRIFVWILIKFLHFISWIKSTYRICAPLKVCPPITNELLFYSAKQIAEKIRHKEIKCEQVIRIYISRIKEVNLLINAIVEERFLDALEEAKIRDQFLATTNLTPDEIRATYPLFGLPLTIKESIGVLNMSHGAGQVFPQKKVAIKDSDVVKQCKEAGAIILLVSNTPELCLNWESFNHVTGRSNNPYDTRRTPGGSSGGEAALIGSGASLFGLGSDIAGSLRIPAQFCGIFGHKPTTETVSLEGHYPSSPDTNAWEQLLILGPMARYASDLPLIMNVIVKKEVKSTLRLEEPVKLNQLKVFFMEDDGNFLTRKINKEIKEKMRIIINHMKHSHSCPVKAIKVEEFKYSPEISYLALLKVDDVEGMLTSGFSILKEILKALICQSKRSFSAIAISLLKKCMNIVPNRWLNLVESRRQRCKTILSETLGKNGILIYPCYNRPAVYHGEAVPGVMDGSYLAIINALGFPSTACTVGLHSSGLPIGIQVISNIYNDRYTIAVAQEIEKLFGGWVEPAQKTYTLTQ